MIEAGDAKHDRAGFARREAKKSMGTVPKTKICKSN
jgi:hypothetical protein